MSVFGRDKYNRDGDSLKDHDADADFAHKASARTKEDLLKNRLTDEALAGDDGKELDATKAWDPAAMARRAERE